jgi:hypothetical protein
MNHRKRKQLDFLGKIADEIYRNSLTHRNIPRLIAFFKGHCRNGTIRELLVEFIEQERVRLTTPHDVLFQTALEKHDIETVFDKAKRKFKDNHPTLWAETEALE